MAERVPTVAVVGWKNSGKTTLVTALVAELSARGLRVATVKHAHHGAAMDVAGSDTARHRENGATATLLVTDDGWSLNASEGPLDLLAAVDRLPACDLVVAEGFKAATVPKVECRRQAADGPLLAQHDRHVFAVAHDGSYAGSLPAFGLDDAPALADEIVAHLGVVVEAS